MPIYIYSQDQNDIKFEDEINNQIPDTVSSVDPGELNAVSIDVDATSKDDLDFYMEQQGYSYLHTASVVLTGNHHWGSFTTANEPTTSLTAGDTGYNTTLNSPVYYSGSAWVKYITDGLEVLNFTPSTAPTHVEGNLYYDSTDKSLSYQTDSDGVTNNIGKEIFVPPKVYNDQGSAITNGQAVYMSGADGTYPEVKLAQANADNTAASIGLITETSIASTGIGYCTTYGLVRDFNTLAWAAGDILYLSPTVAGGLQNTKPVYPNYCTKMAIVISSATSGTLFCTYPQREAGIGFSPDTRSFAIADIGTSGNHWFAGFYDAPLTDTTLTIGGTVTQTYGVADRIKAAHAFVVASGAGGTDLVLTVSGVSINDLGVKNDADSEIIVADTDAATTDQYFETTKKWLGQITYTLTGAAGAFTFNYGFAKYEDFGNRDFTVTDFEVTGRAGASESALNIELYYHSDTGWTYSAAAFAPGASTIVDLATDYGTNNNLASGEDFAYKRTELTQSVSGSGSEGVVVNVTTAVNNSIEHSTIQIGVLL